MMKFFARKQNQRIANYALAALLVFSTITASVPFIFSETAKAASPDYNLNFTKSCVSGAVKLSVTGDNPNTRDVWVKSNANSQDSAAVLAEAGAKNIPSSIQFTQSVIAAGTVTLYYSFTENGTYQQVDGTNASVPYAELSCDTTAPVVEITAPADNALVRGTVTVSGTVTDDNPDHYYLVVKNSSDVYVAGPKIVYAHSVADFIWDTTIVADGLYTIELQARDAVGNKDSTSMTTIEVVVDNNKPEILNLSLSDFLINQTDIDPTLTVDLADATSNIASAKYRVYDNSNAIVVDWTNVSGAFNASAESIAHQISLTAVIADGDYSLKLRIYDEAGNVKTQSIPFAVDRTAPIVAIGTIDALVTDTMPTINGVYTKDAKNDTTVTLSIDDGAAVAVADNLDGTWSYTPVVALAEGAHTFIATASDVADNETASNTLTLTIDSVAPSLSVVSTTSESNTPTVTGTAEVGSTLSVTFNGVISAIANNNGDWTFTSPTTLDNGTYVFAVTATDEAGNEQVRTTDVIVAVADEEAATPAVTEEEAAPAAQAFTITPTTTNPATPSVLGTTNEAADAGVEGVTDEKVAAAVNSDANQGTVFGIAWYWWIGIITGLSILAWLSAGAIRRRNEANS
jgi:hypothetical protein